MDYTSLVGFGADKRPILRRAQINHPLMVSVTDLNSESILNRGIQSMVFPFASTLSLNEPLHPGVKAQQLATSSEASGRLIGVQTFKLDAYKVINQESEQCISCALQPFRTMAIILCRGHFT